MNKRIVGLVAAVVFAMLLSAPFVLAKPDNVPRGPPVHVNDGTTGFIYVTSQGKYYRTIVPYASGTLPYNGHNGGSFQELRPTAGPNGGPETDYGPGDAGFRGGRWWIDSNNNHAMDPEGVDHYFLCPLLGPALASLP